MCLPPSSPLHLDARRHTPLVQPKEQAEASYLEHLAGERRNQMMQTSVIPFVLIVTAFLVFVLVV
jgi:hypothetical protein